MLYILHIPYSVPFFFWILATFRTCIFLNQWAPHQITQHSSSYLSVPLNIQAFNFIAVPGLGQGEYHIFYYICHPSEHSQALHSVHIQEYSQILGPVTNLSPSVLVICGCVCMFAWPAERQNSEDPDETAASIYITEYFPCNRTNKRQARTLIKYLWSRPGTPNDYTYFSSERKNLPLAGAGNPNQTQLIKLYSGQFILGYRSTRQLMC